MCAATIRGGIFKLRLQAFACQYCTAMICEDVQATAVPSASTSMAPTMSGGASAVGLPSAGNCEEEHAWCVCVCCISLCEGQTFKFCLSCVTVGPAI